MEWMKIIGNAISYIARHIADELSVQAIAAEVNVSLLFSKGVCHAQRLYRLGVRPRRLPETSKQRAGEM